MPYVRECQDLLISELVSNNPRQTDYLVCGAHAQTDCQRGCSKEVYVWISSLDQAYTERSNVGGLVPPF